MNRIVALTVALCLVATSTKSSAEVVELKADQAFAVLMSAIGTVSVLRGENPPVVVAFGFALKIGDRVMTGVESGARILTKAGAVLAIGASSTIEILAGPNNVPTISEELGGRNLVRAVRSFIRLKSSDGTSSLTRLRDTAKKRSLNLVSPGKTRILSTHPTFKWNSGDPNAEVTVTVYDDTGVVWRRTVEDATSLEYPKGVEALADGQIYSWAVEISDPLAKIPLRSEPVFFETASLAAAEEFQMALATVERNMEPGNAVYHLIRASICFDSGLLERAITETRAAIALDPLNNELRTILAQLHTDVDRPFDEDGSL